MPPSAARTWNTSGKKLLSAFLGCHSPLRPSLCFLGDVKNQPEPIKQQISPCGPNYCQGNYSWSGDQGTQFMLHTGKSTQSIHLCQKHSRTEPHRVWLPLMRYVQTWFHPSWYLLIYSLSFFFFLCLCVNHDSSTPTLTAVSIPPWKTMNTWTHAHIHTFINAYIHTNIHTYVHAWKRGTGKKGNSIDSIAFICSNTTLIIKILILTNIYIYLAIICSFPFYSIIHYLFILYLLFVSPSPLLSLWLLHSIINYYWRCCCYF